ncbi:MAG: lipoprotein insertase outer membrane protein LolB [Burkholderiaceae bacterium]
MAGWSRWVWSRLVASGGIPSAGALIVGLLMLGLAGCATPESALDRLYTGRFSVVTSTEDKRETVSGRFTVEVRGNRQTIDLATPLGNTVARIEVGPEGARASGPGVDKVQGPDADALMEQMLGWRLPVSGMSDWIEGRPAPGRPARVEREGTRPVLIEQDGWVVRMSEVFPASDRPRLLVLERPASPLAPGVVLRLIVDDPAA